MKKILIIVPTLASYNFLRELCLTLYDTDWEVHLASSGEYENCDDFEKINFHRIDFPRGMNPSQHFVAANKLRRLVKHIDPDFVDVHFSAAAFTVALSRDKNWPATIATVQGLRFPLTVGMNRQAIKFAEKWSASRLDQYIVLTQDDLRALQAVGVSNYELQVGYGFGCDLQNFDKAKVIEEDKKALADKVGKKSTDIVLTFIGRLVSFKGFHLVVKSFFEAQKSNRNIKLVICGDYDDYHDSGLTVEEKAVLKNNESVYLAGWTDNIKNYLAISDFVVFPSEREGVPVNLMEALAMGVPVITCNSRGCREVMNNGNHGIVVESRSIDSITKAILKMAECHLYRERCSRNALEFRYKFDRRIFVDNHIRRITGLL